MLNFKYRLDEPDPSPMELWTENHQILTYTSKYLARQLFPDEIFSNNGQTGEWHRDARQEVIALGWKNVWIIPMGRRAVDGNFDDFVAAISTAPLGVFALDVVYQAPGVGEVDFGWDGPLTVDDVETPLRDYLQRRPHSARRLKGDHCRASAIERGDLLQKLALGARQETHEREPVRGQTRQDQPCRHG